MSDDDATVCPDCNGVGTPWHVDRFVWCSRCSGTGEIQDN